MKTEKKKRILKMLSVFLVCGYAFAGQTIYLEAANGPYASNPIPADGAVDVSIETNLTWMRGEGAKWDKVYFGTDPCDANLSLVATIPDYLPAEYDPCDPDPGTEPNLLPSTTYYWYITEVNAPNEYQGPVCSFSTIPGEAQCDYPEDGAVIPGDVYAGNLYTELIFIPGPTAIQHTGYFSKVRDEVANRAEDAKIPPPMWPPIPHEHKYIVPLPPESLIRGQVYYWTDDETDSFGNTFLGDVWEFTVQDYYAYAPSPVDGANDVDPNVLLSWLPGYGAANHDVFIGTSWEDVNNAYFTYPVHNSSPEYQGTTDPCVLSWQMNGLDPETKYYWRIDEVQGRFPPSPGTIYKGDVWCFTTVISVETYHVDGATGDNTNDGLTRGTAFATIQRGINVAQDGDTVLVWPGVYNEEIGFWGDAITVKSAANAAIVETNYGYAFSFFSAEGPDTVLSNFIIRNSQYGIYLINGASPSLRNLTIVNNDFGISAFNGSDPDISNCILWGNNYGDLFRDPVPLEAKYSFVQEEIEANLVAYWKLDGDANDSAGDNDGTIYGAVPTTGQIGGAFSFDGDDYVQVADDDSLDISNKITISAWINPSYTSSIRVIVSKYKDYAGMSYVLALRYEKLHFMLRDVGPFFGIQTFSTGIWYHVAATYDGSRMRGYINGELDNEQAASGTIPITTQELNIGRQADNNLWPFEGLIDEVRIYDRGLSSEEIEALYNTGLAGHEYSPLFVDANSGDYHLLSERGRYWPVHDVWVLDDVTSSCVDGGDPNVDPSNEPMPNGGRINMGAYGNTAYASMSEWPIKGDINNDGRFNFVDIAILLDEWLAELPWAQ